MEFTEFAEILKPIIGGSYSTHVFTRRLDKWMILQRKSSSEKVIP